MENLQEQVVEGKLYYALVGSRNVGVYETEDDLFAALMHRNDWVCSVYAAEDLELLNLLVRQHYHQFFCQRNDSVNTPLSLPTGKGMYSLYTQGDLVNDTEGENNLAQIGQAISPADCNYGHWGIHGLNGFGVLQRMEDLVGVLAYRSFEAPWAMWFPNIDAAHNWAREWYIYRFYHYFDPRQEMLFLPNKFLPAYIDELFAMRKERRTSSFSMELKTLMELGY